MHRRLNGQEKYLKIAKRFNHIAVIGPAQERQDKLTGLHANTQAPKFVGVARQYELTADTLFVNLFIASELRTMRRN